jgi:hypothetical protein
MSVEKRSGKRRRRDVTGDARSRNAANENSVIRWLMTEGRHITDARDFLESFASCLADAGVDVSRITTGVPILHPQLFFMSALWERDKGVTERLYRADLSQDATLANSPIRAAYDGRPFRSRLMKLAENHEFPILDELRRGGVTDYVVLPVPFSDGTNKALSPRDKPRRRILRRRDRDVVFLSRLGGQVQARRGDALWRWR